MTNDDTPSRIHAANAARVRILAEAAAQDPVKLAKAERVVRAAIRQGLLDVADLANEQPEQAPA